MTRLDKLGIIKNVSSSWLGLLVNVATGIIISPYILHKLGDDAFGLWVLVFAITGYYGLFDFGIRSSIVRYVAKYSAVGDKEQLNRLISTSLFAYTCIGLIALLFTAVVSFHVDKIFHIQIAYITASKILFFMVGASLSLGFPLGVFGGILEGLQRFYLLNSINMVNTILRAVLIVVFLDHGFGLLTAALITVAFPIINGLVNAINAIRLTAVQLRWRFVSKGVFKEIANYGSVKFIIGLAWKLRFKTDALVIGTFLSSAAVTYFAIAGRIVDYSTDVVSSLAQIFVPMSSQSQAKGDQAALRRLFVVGNRGCAFVIFPITAVLIVLGRSIIEVWMGAKYVGTSYPVLLVLLIPITLMLAQAASGRILYGMAKHRTWAVVVITEGIANVILSIVLVRRYGILGDAFGTAIPLACSMLFFLPHHLCRLLDIKFWTYVRHAFFLPLVLCTPLVAALLAMQHWFVPHNYPGLALQLFLALLVYTIGLLWAIYDRHAFEVADLPAREGPPRMAAAVNQWTTTEDHDLT